LIETAELIEQFFVLGFFPSYCTLCFKGARLAPEIMVLSLGTFPQTLDIENFYHCSSTVVNLLHFRLINQFYIKSKKAKNGHFYRSKIYNIAVKYNTSFFASLSH